MTLDHKTYCFVCTHLASGEKEGDEIKRNSHVMEILKKTRFSDIEKSHILDHEYVIVKLELYITHIVTMFVFLLMYIFC